MKGVWPALLRRALLHLPLKLPDRPVSLGTDSPRALLYVTISAGLWAQVLVSLSIGMAATPASINGQIAVLDGVLAWPWHSVGMQYLGRCCKSRDMAVAISLRHAGPLITI